MLKGFLLFVIVWGCHVAVQGSWCCKPPVLVLHITLNHKPSDSIQPADHCGKLWTNEIRFSAGSLGHISERYHPRPFRPVRWLCAYREHTINIRLAPAWPKYIFLTFAILLSPNMAVLVRWIRFYSFPVTVISYIIVGLRRCVNVWLVGTSWTNYSQDPRGTTCTAIAQISGFSPLFIESIFYQSWNYFNRFTFWADFDKEIHKEY